MTTGMVNNPLTGQFELITFLPPVEEYVQHEHILVLPLSGGPLCRTRWGAPFPPSPPENPWQLGLIGPCPGQMLPPRLERSLSRQLQSCLSPSKVDLRWVFLPLLFRLDNSF